MPRKAKTDIIDPDALYAKAVDLVQQGNPTPALTAINKALKARPKWPEALVVRGTVRLQQGEFWKGASDFREAVRLRPDYTEASLKLGQTYLMTESYQIAERTFEGILDKGASADARLGRGLARVGVQNFKGAAADLDEAIRLRPDFAEAWYARGDLNLLQNDPHQAVKDFTEAIRLNPNVAGFYIERARAYINLKDYEHGLADYDIVTSLAPVPSLYLERGDVHYDRGNYQSAAEDYQQYIDLGGSENGPALRRMSRIVFQLRMRAASHEGRYRSRRWF
jgi:tetratricopeptide (TPR) repeat protein